jgi:competence protein ComEC
VVVGVPHHGSEGGFSAGLLRQLAPRLAVVPVGPNRHGHPAADALAVLTAAGVPYARTDERGEIALAAGGGGLSVTVERGG